MKWEAISAIGEVVSAAGVLFATIYSYIAAKAAQKSAAISERTAHANEKLAEIYEPSLEIVATFFGFYHDKTQVYSTDKSFFEGFKNDYVELFIVNSSFFSNVVISLGLKMNNHFEEIYNGKPLTIQGGGQVFLNFEAEEAQKIVENWQYFCVVDSSNKEYFLRAVPKKIEEKIIERH